MQRFGIPGKTLLGSDSHTCAAGSLGMLAIGAGGLEVAMAMAGEPFHLTMPEVWGVRLVGALPDWVSAKDVILEMLRRHDVKGGLGRIIEYHGPGLASLSAMDRHVIANMGAELGATTTVFPSDEEVQRFLVSEDREHAWIELRADAGCTYDVEEEIDLSRLEPLIALPSSPGNVVTVREVSGTEIYQCVIGSSANPGLRDLAIAALIVDGKQAHDRVSLDINPTSRQTLETLDAEGYLLKLIAAGARIHQAGCMGCIGMGQAPATGRISLRTVPRNFPGRSGTAEDSVYLCSPETAAASALTGMITDPRDLGIAYPRFQPPRRECVNTAMLVPPTVGRGIALVKGPNIASLPDFEPLSDTVEGPVLLKLGDNVSTDEILPAGAKVLPFRSNIPAISRFAFAPIDETYHDRALARRDGGGHFVVAGDNYGQGSSREHAAIAPRYLGLHAVIAKRFARIHAQNLVNFGVLPITFTDPDDYDRVDDGDELAITHARDQISSGSEITVVNRTKGHSYRCAHDLSSRQVELIVAGSLITFLQNRSNPSRAEADSGSNTQ
jgi:aconitate hydratase